MVASERLDFWSPVFFVLFFLGPVKSVDYVSFEMGVIRSCTFSIMTYLHPILKKVLRDQAADYSGNSFYPYLSPMPPPEEPLPSPSPSHQNVPYHRINR
jgi:hypothetical protein